MGVLMVISSRTPEGQPNRCPVCGSASKIEPSDPAGDAPCPACGHLLWFTWAATGTAEVIKPTCSILRPEDLDMLLARWPEKRGVRLTLDLSAVPYLSSAALAKLISLKKKVVGVSGKLTLENLHPDLLEVFRLTRLDQVFDIG
jgi:anti-sigma B factor antagonist